MSLGLVKDYLEGKIPTTLAVILINLAFGFIICIVDEGWRTR
jgi:hypothetical protein